MARVSRSVVAKHVNLCVRSLLEKAWGPTGSLSGLPTVKMEVRKVTKMAKDTEAPAEHSALTGGRCHTQRYDWLVM